MRPTFIWIKTFTVMIHLSLWHSPKFDTHWINHSHWVSLINNLKLQSISLIKGYDDLIRTISYLPLIHMQPSSSFPINWHCIVRVLYKRPFDIISWKYAFLKQKQKKDFFFFWKISFLKYICEDSFFKTIKSHCFYFKTK